MSRFKKRGIKFGVTCLVFLTAAGWIFSGWPRIWQNPRIPPEVKKAEAGTERLSPDGATFVLTSLTGAYTDVGDDPDSPDGLWLIAANNNSNTAVEASFPTPTGNPTVGADLQEFRVLFRQFDEAQTGTPEGRIELWENGVLVRAGTDTAIPDGGVVLSFKWNANELATADGSLVEVNAVGTKAGGATGARNSAEVGAIEWNVDYAAGTLTTDIVNASYVSVGSPTVAMNATTFDFACQTVTGSFGTASQQIYVNNDNGGSGGWTLTLAAQNTTDVWDSAGTDYDFNDPGSSGCVDDGATTDVDNLGGQMTVDASGATLAVGQCGGCTTNNISKGSSASYIEGTTDTVTLLTATAASDDVGDWTLQGVSISQKIPAEQPAASDYSINMVLTVTAS